MSEIGRLLPPRLRSGRIGHSLVVIADHQRQVARLRLGESPWATGRVVPIVGPSEAELHEQLAELGDLAVVVDVRRSSGPAQLRAFERSFFHVGRGGAWVLLRAGWLPERREPAVVLARRLQDPRAAMLGRRWREHARSTSFVRITPRAVVIGQGTRHLLRLRDHEALDLLPLRESRLRVTEIARLDAGEVDTDGLLHEYGGSPRPQVPRLVPFPMHHVRRYEGAVHLPRAGLAYHGRSVLPDSFRWHLAADPQVPGLVNVDDHFGRLRRRQPVETLPGSYFSFGYNNPGHFGHLMTEAVAKLWGWDAAKAADPSLKVLCRLHPRGKGGGMETRLETTLLPAFGIARDDITWVDRPVTVTSLVGCTPMWHNAPPFYVHPAILDTWDRLRTGLLGTDPVGEDRRIFVTRREGKRGCRNVGKVERFFAARGFRIVAPEELGLAEQAAVFAGARVVAGFGGAGMFNLAYARSVETVIVLNQWSYQARNEHLFAAAHGAELHCFWSRPNQEHPEGGFSYHAHQSRWAFDFRTNGPPLRRLLDGLVE
jgi:capsular polysaccharide biosynthesis protein